MTKVKITSLIYGSAAKQDYKLGEIADLPAEEAERAVEANVAVYVGGAPASPSPAPSAEEDEDEFGGESVAMPTKKTGKGR